MHLLRVITLCGLLFSVKSQVDLEACGVGHSREIHMDSGSVSMSYDDYPFYATCTWHVYAETQQSQKVAVITVENLQFEDTLCKKSYLKLFDNVGSTSDTLMDYRCDPATGTQSYTRISKSPSFTIEYRDMSERRYGNMVIHFDFIEPSTETVACGFDGPEKVAPGEGQIMTPAPDAGFPLNNIECRWIIEGNADEFVLGEVEKGTEFRSGDYVTCHDGDNKDSAVLATWNNHNLSLTPVHNGGPYMYIEMGLGPEEEGIQPLMTFNFETIKTYEWACDLTTSLPQPPAMLTQVDDVVLKHPDYNETKALDLKCHWSIAPGAGWYVAASVRDFTLGFDANEPCAADTSPLLTIGSESESFFCGSEENTFLNYSFPAINVILDAPASTRLESDYFMINTSGSNIAEMACSSTAVLTNQPGVITNEDYPNATPTDKVCAWVIKAGKKQLVRLEILEYTADCSDPECGFSIEDVHNNGPSNVTQLAIISAGVGPDHPVVVHSSDREMNVKYNCFSCSETSKGTFRMKYTFHDLEEGCENPILTAEEGVISSPGYGEGTYPVSADCEWVIAVPNPEGKHQSIVLDFIDLSLRYGHDEYDSISIHDGTSENSTVIDHLTSQFVGLPPTVATNQTMAFLKMNSSSRNDAPLARGFTLRYYVSSEPHADMACAEKSRPTLVYKDYANIMSPGYPTSLPSDQHCTWRVDADHTEMFELKFMDMDLGTNICVDVIAAGTDGYNKSIAQYCGADKAIGDTLYVAAAHTYINFTSESVDSERGFNVTRRILKSNDRACTLNGQPIGVEMSVSGQFESPDLNFTRGEQMLCRWLFNANIDEVIDVQLDELDLGGDCDVAALKLTDKVRDEKVVRDYECGYRGWIDHIWLGPTETMAEFYAKVPQDAEHLPVFRASAIYHNVTEEACTGNGLFSFNWAPGYIVTPNYGIGFYPPWTELIQPCVWEITAPLHERIRLHFEDFDVGEPDTYCYNEYLFIIEYSLYPYHTLGSRRFCGSVIPKDFVSEDQKLKLQLYTSIVDNFKRGFKIMYTFEPNTVGHSKPDPLLIGLLCAGLLLLCIVVVFVVVYFYRKRKTQQKTMNNSDEVKVDLGGSAYDAGDAVHVDQTNHTIEMKKGPTYQPLAED